MLEPYCLVQINTSLSTSEQYDLWQRSPTFLASGTSFVEDHFSMDWGGGGGGGFRMIQASRVCALMRI